MNHKPLRILTLLLTLAILMTAFVACGGEDTPADGTTPSGNASTTTEPPANPSDPTSQPGESTPEVTEPLDPMEVDSPNFDTNYPNVSAELTYETRDFALTRESVHKRVKADGRSMITDRGMTVDWSGAALEFDANCSGDVALTFYVAGGQILYFNVHIDGSMTEKIAVGGNQTVTVAEDLEAGVHKIRLVRITMVESGNTGVTCDLVNIKMDGVMLPKPADKDYYIEFVGDSVTCGVGTKGSGGAGDGYAYADDSFAYQTAVALDVDYSIVSISGIGTMKSTSRHNGLNIYGAYKYFNYYRSPKVAFTATRQADVVVIGTNANDPDSSNIADFKQHIRAMIEQMQEIHGEDTKFVWVFDMYTDRPKLNSYVRSVFTELGGEDAGFYTVEFFVNKDGGSVHPNAAAHDTYTEILVEFFEEKNILS